MQITLKLERLAAYLLLTAAGVLFLYPIALVFLSSVKSTHEFMGNPIGWPEQFTLANYIAVWSSGNIARYFVNSSVITIFSVLGTVTFGAMAAYGLLRNFRGSGTLLVYFLLGMMIPSQVTAIATFIFLKKIHLLDTYSGLIFVYISHHVSVAVFMFAGFFKGIPKEIEEAAALDGCTEWRTFWQIIMPVSRPIIATVVILCGMWVWNDFFLPLVLLLDQAKLTLPLGLLRLKGEYSVNWPQFFSAIAMNISPVIILFLFLQKQFIEGMTSGSVKG